jgi:hypothetical protein
MLEIVQQTENRALSSELTPHDLSDNYTCSFAESKESASSSFRRTDPRFRSANIARDNLRVNFPPRKGIVLLQARFNGVDNLEHHACVDNGIHKIVLQAVSSNVLLEDYTCGTLRSELEKFTGEPLTVGRYSTPQVVLFPYLSVFLV